MDLPDGTEVEAKTAAALSGKLCQLAGGSIYQPVQDKITGKIINKTHNIHNQKLDEVREIQEETAGENLIIGYWYQSSRAKLLKAFPEAVALDKVGSQVADWNAGKIPMLLVHPQSAGHGLNLQYGGWRLIFYDLCWSYELFIQLIGRIHRQGQTRPVFVHPIICRGTVDEIVAGRLDMRKDAQEALFSMIRRWRDKMKADTKASLELTSAEISEMLG
jgi:hypothetical protein